MKISVLLAACILAILSLTGMISAQAEPLPSSANMPFPELSTSELNKVVDQLMDKLQLDADALYPGSKLEMRALLIDAASSRATPNAIYFNGANAFYYQYFVQLIDAAHSSKKASAVEQCMTYTLGLIAEHPVTGPKVK